MNKTLNQIEYKKINIFLDETSCFIDVYTLAKEMRFLNICNEFLPYILDPNIKENLKIIKRRNSKENLLKYLKILDGRIKDYEMTKKDINIIIDLDGEIQSIPVLHMGSGFSWSISSIIGIFVNKTIQLKIPENYSILKKFFEVLQKMLEDMDKKIFFVVWQKSTIYTVLSFFEEKDVNIISYIGRNERDKMEFKIKK